MVIISLYVRNLLIADTLLEVVRNIKSDLSLGFNMEDYGEANVCLGFEISRDRSNRSLFIAQLICTKIILERFEISDCEPAS